MENEALKNADRFSKFAQFYDEARPQMPLYPVRVIVKYLGKTPERVVDLGCGTGLSTLIWKDHCGEAVGIEPNDDMLAVARAKETKGLTFRKGFSHDTGLPENFADAVVCSQSFHWMEPVSTLAEVNRILKPGGIFATVDCDWPPVCGASAEKAYRELFTHVRSIEKSVPELSGRFVKWDKGSHLANIDKSGHFSNTREIVFSNTESCTSGRFVKLALSQGSLQAVLNYRPELITEYLEKFRKTVFSSLGDGQFEIDFCYRMRIGIKHAF